MGKRGDKTFDRDVSGSPSFGGRMSAAGVDGVLYDFETHWPSFGVCGASTDPNLFGGADESVRNFIEGKGLCV